MQRMSCRRAARTRFFVTASTAPLPAIGRSATLGTASAAPSAKDLGNPKRSVKGLLDNPYRTLQLNVIVLRGQT
jgi:hypothetical protein